MCFFCLAFSVKMPGLARKILICAAVDGLIVQPLSPKGQRPFQPVQIKYGDAAISSVSRDQVPDTETSFEAFGVVGEALLLNNVGNVARANGGRLDHGIETQLSSNNHAKEAGCPDSWISYICSHWRCYNALLIQEGCYGIYPADS